MHISIKYYNFDHIHQLFWDRKLCSAILEELQQSKSIWQYFKLRYIEIDYEENTLLKWYSLKCPKTLFVYFSFWIWRKTKSGVFLKPKFMLVHVPKFCFIFEKTISKFPFLFLFYQIFLSNKTIFWKNSWDYSVMLSEPTKNLSLK